MEIRKNSEWFEMLTKDEQERYKRNCIKQEDEYFFERCISIKHNFGYFICSGFSWVDSDEGFDYWYNICRSHPYERLINNAKDIDVKTSDL